MALKDWKKAKPNKHQIYRWINKKRKIEVVIAQLITKKHIKKYGVFFSSLKKELLHKKDRWYGTYKNLLKAKKEAVIFMNRLNTKEGRELWGL